MTHLEHLLNEAGFDLIRPRGGPAKIVYVDRRGHPRESAASTSRPPGRPIPPESRG